MFTLMLSEVSSWRKKEVREVTNDPLHQEPQSASVDFATFSCQQGIIFYSLHLLEARLLHS